MVPAKWPYGLSLLMLFFVLSGCAVTPESATLTEARRIVEKAEQDPKVKEAAAADLAKAQTLLQQSTALQKQGEPQNLVDHRAYLAMRHAEIALAQAQRTRVEQTIEDADNERLRLLMKVRELETERAKQRALAKEQEAEQAKLQALSLQQELEELKARRTPRGLVLTLGDILFDTNEANLKPGAANTLDELAEFLNTYPERNILIEGHTDSTGPTEYNRQLSQRRANAVRDALRIRGISADRIHTVGLGEQYPVASNDNAGGRQQNRRVDIIISDESGQIKPRQS